MKLVTAATMRDMDRRTVDEFGIPGIILMENAALRVVEAVAARRPDLSGSRVVVVCGKGNNGGDGFAIARHLAVRYDAVVDIWTSFDHVASDQQESDAVVNLKMATAHSLSIRQCTDESLSDFEMSLAHAEIVVDALFGTGISGAARGIPAAMIERINAARSVRVRRQFVVAVDVPSGVDADTGAVAGPAVSADLTVTFALAKLGQFVYPGFDYTGELVVGDIAMPRTVVKTAPAAAWLTTDADVARLLPARVNGRDANKGTYGHVFVFAGSKGFLGAAKLASLAAARAGAGLVTLCVPEGLLGAAMASASPVVMIRGLPETGEGTFALAGLDEAVDLCGRSSAVAIGPGIGSKSDETAQFVRELIARCPSPLVIDADALNVLADSPDRGAPIVAGRTTKTILTPHPGEMGRLLGLSTALVQADRMTAVKTAAERYGAAVVLKGARTLVAGDGRVNVNMSGNPGMATGGAGDVLTGVSSALLAQGVDAFDAAAMAVYVHGVAGDIAAARHGTPAGLTAEDLIDDLPTAVARCQTAGKLRQ